MNNKLNREFNKCEEIDDSTSLYRSLKINSSRNIKVLNYEQELDTYKKVDLYHYESLYKKQVPIDYSINEEQYNNIKVELSKKDFSKEILLNNLSILKDTIGVEQLSKIHSFDVFEHIVATIKSIEKSIEVINENGIKVSFDSSKIEEMKLTMLFHDISKPYCNELEESMYQFTDHEALSAKMTESILKNVNIENKSRIIALINNHGAFYDENYKNLIKNFKMVIKHCKISKENYYEKVKELSEMLLVVKLADVIGQDLKYSESKCKTIFRNYEVINRYLKFEKSKNMYKSLYIKK